MASPAVREVVRGVWEVALGPVNAFLADLGDGGLAAIDTGVPGSAPRIVEAARSIGRGPDAIRHIVVTHAHSDHAGGLAELKRLTGAPAWMHPADAALVREGRSIRPVATTPGLLNTLIVKLFVAGAPTAIEPAEVEHEVEDGATLPGGLRAVHAPGHCAGQVALLRPDDRGGLLFAADAAAHVFGLALSPVHEDLAEGKRSLARIAALPFEAACFGHGRPIAAGAAGQFRRKFGA